MYCAVKKNQTPVFMLYTHLHSTHMVTCMTAVQSNLSKKHSIHVDISMAFAALLVTMPTPLLTRKLIINVSSFPFAVILMLLCTGTPPAKSF